MEALISPSIEWAVADLVQPGQSESGDRSVILPTGEGVLVAVVDGLGHGAEAASAAKVAVRALERGANRPVVQLFRDCHSSLIGTRGAVISAAAFDAGDGSMTWLGVGDVEGRLLRAPTSAGPRMESLLLRGGVVGVHLPTLVSSVVPIHRGDTLIFASDGVGVHDMAAIQHRALLRSLMRVRTREESSSTLRAASRFIVESLLPFEMSHRKSQEVNAALRESEERYRSVVDTARDIIYTLSADGRIMSMNPVFETVTGWSRTEWIGKDYLPLVHPDDRPPAAEIFQAVLKGQVPPIFELGVRAKSGFTIPSEFVATPLTRGSRIVGVLGIARDITDRKSAERALRHLNEALEEEVKRIAHALHDEAGQLPASVHIRLADAARDLPAPAARP